MGIEETPVGTIEQFFVKVSSMISDLNGKLELHAERMSNTRDLVLEVKADLRDARADIRQNYTTKEEAAALRAAIALAATKEDVAPFKKGAGEIIKYVGLVLLGLLLKVIFDYAARPGT